MTSLSQKFMKQPIIILLVICAVTGLFIFRDFGFTWDEPLDYAYGDALGYAYNPANWFSGHFDLNKSYGPSADDHKNRGPAYLFLAREPVYLIEKFHINTDDAWHLVNFLTFLLGVFFLYKICERFMQPWAAMTASAFFIFQPLLWGHAFINDKDAPFLVFLTGAVYLGFHMVDQLAVSKEQPWGKTFVQVFIPAFFVGIATSIRVLGPLAGIFVVIYFLTRHPTRRTILWMVLYAVLSILIMLATWPYLWESPLRFIQVFQFMSENPTDLQVLFGGEVYRAYNLPHRYLPFYLTFTLTEPVWPLFMVGLTTAYRKLKNDPPKLTQVLLILAWFLIPLAYTIIRNPPNFDGMRHFLFMIPPIFIFAGFALDWLFEKVRITWINAVLVILLLAPGIYGMIQLHPYEYAYYNSFVGGTGGVFRKYETDYWMTCYKEAIKQFNQLETKPVTLAVHRVPLAAAPYAAPNVTILNERTQFNLIKPGDFILVNTRTNEDTRDFHGAPYLLTVGRAGATFCIIKEVTKVP
jgi:4-amino-4-deoxy-L-arabinose transferase-like glycosyltransferase